MSILTTVLHTCVDARLRAIVFAALTEASAGPLRGPLRCRDLLAAVIRSGDRSLLGPLAQGLSPGANWDAVQALLRQAPTSSAQGGALGPHATSALASFDRVLQEAGQTVHEVAAEVFVQCVLRHLEEPQALPLLDVETAIRALGEVIAARMAKPRGGERASRQTGPTKTSPFRLPEELGPFDDLTDRVRTGAVTDLFPFDGEPVYERLFDDMARILHRRQAGHVLLTGEPGVGKSTVVVELARRAALGGVASLADKRFLLIDCRFVPAEESKHRLAGLLSCIAHHPDLVVAIDGFARLLRNERGGSHKACLLSALLQARCRLVGLLTTRDDEELIADDPEFGDFFGRVQVPEPDWEVALKILRHFAAGLREKFHIAIDDEAVRQAVVLSHQYILNDQLPAKALKILHRICEDADFERNQHGTSRTSVGVVDVIRVVSESSGVPEETLRGVAGKSDYEQNLREVIYGQDHAVREVAIELGLIKSGMTDPGKPASVMLFIGQTGTGKTEIAKTLARFYSVSKRLRTYTLGNCVEPHSVSTIIGVPPGYVGNDQGGRLINELNADPYCVFLLDEADKAHPDVLQPFLNLFDEGWVCDQRGVRAYANKSIFILTTNVGQRMIADMVQQNKSQEEITERMKEALSQIKHSKSERPVFTAEFLARIKRIIVFRPLDRAALEGISKRIVSDMKKSWEVQRGKQLEIPDSLVTALADRAHHLNEKSKGREGGRIVRKLVSDWIESAVQRELSQRTSEYKACTSVVVEHVVHAGISPAEEAVPELQVHLRP